MFTKQEGPEEGHSLVHNGPVVPSSVIQPLDKKNPQTTGTKKRFHLGRGSKPHDSSEIAIQLQDPSPATKERGVSSGVLSPGEQVFYDEPHAWLAIMLTILNPMWPRDRDVPSRLEDPKRQRYTFVDTLIVTTLRVFTRVSQVLVGGVTIIALVGMLSFGWIKPKIQYPFSEWWYWALVLAFVAVVFAIWAWYIIPVAQRCRLVVTERFIWAGADQMNWRDDLDAKLDISEFRRRFWRRTPLMRIFQTAEFLPSTNDNPEPLPYWPYARDWRRLYAIIEYLLRRIEAKE